MLGAERTSIKVSLHVTVQELELYWGGVSVR